jgi:hypothetical protein
MHLREPAQISGLRINPQHVRVFEVADDQRMTRD